MTDSEDIIKEFQILEKLRQYKSLLVALSGGVDSTLLLDMANQALPGAVVAVTVDTPVTPRWEIQEAQTVCRSIGIDHTVVVVSLLENSDFVANRRDRCYVCKMILFRRLLWLAKEKGLDFVAHGANADDENDYRPGLAAAKKLGIIAPLADEGATKATVRKIAKTRGLTQWNKPSSACLASRIPYDMLITREKIATVEEAETFLKNLGFSQCRVRHHGNMASIEVEPEKMKILVSPNMANTVTSKLSSLGFSYVNMDLSGYRTGSLNREIISKDKKTT